MTAPPLTSAGRVPGAGRAGARRMWSLGRAEALLLRRNPMALAIGLGMPLGLTVMLQFGQPPDAAAQIDAAGSLTALTAFALLSILYYNLVTSLVARRQDLVLKRLRTGELSDWEVLAGSALPAAGLAWAQVLIAAVSAVAFFDLAPPVNVVVAVAGLVLGTLVFALLAAVVASFTRSVEMAQLTAMPILLLSATFGVLVPTADLNDPLQLIVQALPMPRVVELLQLGLSGDPAGGGSLAFTATFGHALAPVLVLLAWVGAALWATRRWFRWEPRG